MDMFIKRYNMELTAIGPVHIGGGTQTNKKEALFDRINSRIIFFDTEKMLNWIVRKNFIKRYQGFILGSNSDIGSFFRENKIAPKVYEEWIAYTVTLGNAELNEATHKGISNFIRNGRGELYIPGSSIKGMLRSVLAGAELIRNSDKYTNVKESVKNSIDVKSIEKQAIGLEREIFNKKIFDSDVKDAVNDSMRGIYISDSEVIDEKDSLCICQKLDINYAGKEKPLPLLRECIRPGVKVRFQLSIDRKISAYSIEDIFSHVDTYYNNYRQTFLTKFTGKYGNIKGKHIVFLGGGAGFPTKTLQYSMFSRNEAVNQVSKVLKVKFPKHKHENDRLAHIGISPRTVKLAVYTNAKNKKSERYHMGACSIDLNDVEA